MDGLLRSEKYGQGLSFARPPKIPSSLPDPSHFPDPYPYRQQHSLSSTPPALSSSSGSARSGGSAMAADYSHVRVASNDTDDDGRITSDSVGQLLASDPRASEQSRWSESYSSVRSRSSTSASSTDHHLSPRLQQKKSYDMGWQHAVDERDEFAASEEETDEDHILLQDDDDQEDDEERTSAALIAEEGRGMIVQGEGLLLSDLNVQPGTTHLLLGSSGSPNALPSFLTTLVPQISTSLLALDISANFLNALPPTLALCVCLEELNIASNPLRVLPVFLADLLHLRVLIADSTGISTLPDTLVDLDKLHRSASGAIKCTPSPAGSPSFPPCRPSASMATLSRAHGRLSSSRYSPKCRRPPYIHPPPPWDADTDDDLSEPPSSGPSRRGFETVSPEEEEYTITPDRARSPGEGRAQPVDDTGYFGDHEIRRMKSVGDLRPNHGADPSARPPMQHYATSHQTPPRPGMQKRFASVGPANAMNGSPSRSAPGSARLPLTQSMWENSAAPERVDTNSSRSRGSSFIAQNNTSPPRVLPFDGGTRSALRPARRRAADRPPSPRPLPQARPQIMRGPATAPMSRGSPDRFAQSPQINMRISTTGTLDAFNPPPMIHHTLPPAAEEEERSPPPSAVFLPIDSPLTLNIPIPEAAAFVPGMTATSDTDGPDGARVETPSPVVETYLRREEERQREAYQRALRSVMAYLKDMNDLGLSQQAATMGMYGAGGDEASMSSNGSSSLDSVGQLRSMDSLTGMRAGNSTQTNSVATTDSTAMVVREIVNGRTYVKGLQELVDIYIKPGAAPVNVLGGSSKDTVVPAAERKVVFGGIDALFSFHKESFLPALEIAAAPLMKSSAELAEADADGQLSLNVAKAIGSMFLKHAAFMKMYSSYINNFDNAVQRVKNWTATPGPSNTSPAMTPSATSTSQLAGLGLTLSAISSPVVTPDGGAAGLPPLSTSQRKRLRTYLKRCRISPRHSQLNLEGYLLLPVQRIPRYRLLLEELLRATPPTYEYMDDPLDRSLAEISLLANNMNEGKRESESRRKLVQWQARIRGKFPSPLVQPHRRLIMDGQLLLTRVVRKAMVSFEAINAQGDPCTVQVDWQDPTCHVDLWAVLRMQTLPQPASIVHGNALRLVDNKAILYFDAPSPSDALNWYRAINLHIPKT
ncbi:hypothetical protein B0H13DRAFT_2231022 [Mycena leptocephala]|nr:hypothetical protein B0H13DRAFT_2231022 [Mycena leptocephala]